MTAILRKLRDILSENERRRTYPLFALVLAMAVIETLGIASIMPFIALLSNPTILETNRYLAIAYDWLGFASHEAFLIFFGLCTFVLLVGSVVLRAVTLWMQLRFVNTQTHNVATRLMAAYLRQPYQWFLKHRSSDMGANILNEVATVFQSVAYPLMLLFANGAVVLLLTSLLIAVDPVLAVTMIAALGGIYLLIFLAGQKHMSRAGSLRVKANRQRHQALYEAFGGIKDIKITGTETNFLRRFSTPSEQMARISVNQAVISEMPTFVLQALVFGGMLLVILYLIMTHGTLQEALPVISLYGIAGYRLLPTVQSTYKNLATLRYNLPGLDVLHRDVCEFEGKLSESGPSEPEALTHASIHLTKSLVLRDISFRYENAAQPALRGLNLTISAYSTIALVGSTGSGKTTTVDVILGLLEPSEGQIVVDGAPVSRGNNRAWQRCIGYVPQSIFLTDDTVAANIAFGVAPESIDRVAVENAGRVANLHEFVEKQLPNGYDTPIGERGVRLSGGQRQRIGIARALYHDPEVLIFDEATSALDNVTEQIVMDAVYQLGRKKTIILIAHRLSTVRECDRIFVLDRGEVVDAGRYDELLSCSKAFRAMALRESESAENEGQGGVVADAATELAGC